MKIIRSLAYCLSASLLLACASEAPHSEGDEAPDSAFDAEDQNLSRIYDTDAPETAPSVPSPDRAESEGAEFDVLLAVAPACAATSVTSGGGVFVTNNCGSAIRVKAVFSRRSDSHCTTIEPGVRVHFSNHSGGFPNYSRFDSLQNC
ncbi:MAG: hypothetical protein ABW252_11280 [Polyangiales bacterium]